jgi:hypothetical protein
MATDNPVDSYTGPLNDSGTGEPGFDRSGPLLSVEELRSDFLFGIPLRSAITHEEMSDETLKRFISRAVSDFETETRLSVSPKRFVDRWDYDRTNDYYNSSPRQLTRFPLIKIEEIAAIMPGRPDTDTPLTYPTNWITPQGDTGLVRMVPVNGASLAAAISFSGVFGYGIMMGSTRIPNFWKITFVAGMEHDKIPHVVNELIGTKVAIKVLSAIGPSANPASSWSIGGDGLSQSVSTMGPQQFTVRMNELQQAELKLTAQIKNHFNTDMYLFSI